MQCNNPKYCLILSRKLWEELSERMEVYYFSKQDLDNAESSDDYFIGERNGVLCYLQPVFR